MYEVIVPDRIEKKLPRILGGAYDRVLRAIQALGEEPRPHGCASMKGSDLWRIRVGDYRVIHGIDDTRRVGEILKVAHRRESYR